MSSYDETQSDPVAGDQPDPTTAVPGEVAGDDNPDEDDDEDDDTGSDEPDVDDGVIGPPGIADLVDCANRLGQLGRAARSRLGDRIVALADEARAIAHEARRRLEADRLPEDAGTPDQRARIDDEHDRRAGHPPAHNTVEG